MKADFIDKVENKTNEELVNIYVNPWDYQQDFVDLAYNELIKRKVDLVKINEEKSASEKAMDIELGEGKAGDQFLIVIGFISALLGGILGILIGYRFNRSMHHKNTVKDYYIYNQKTRDLGSIMMAIRAIVLFFSIIYRLY
ncbi:MAG TPA: hypothetical protein VGO09_11550 [Flavisolibacter sp.]|jgi:hypothetical protein|nr:hypothetical protein [Flavisolibacter sp.]